MILYSRFSKINFAKPSYRSCSERFILQYYKKKDLKKSTTFQIFLKIHKTFLSIQ